MDAVVVVCKKLFVMHSIHLLGRLPGLAAHLPQRAAHFIEARAREGTMRVRSAECVLKESELLAQAGQLKSQYQRDVGGCAKPKDMQIEVSFIRITHHARALPNRLLAWSMDLMDSYFVKQWTGSLTDQPENRCLWLLLRA